MTLHSIGRRLDTVGGGDFKIGNQTLEVVPEQANIAPPFSDWSLGGGATVDSEGILTLPVANSSYAFAYMPVNEAAKWVFSAEVYCDNMSPQASSQPNATRLYNSAYFAADKTTLVANSGGWTGNGNAGTFAPSQWSPRYGTVAPFTNGAWSFLAGPGIHYVRIRIDSSSTYIAPPIHYRLPMMTAGADHTYPQYSHYYKKGLEQ